MTETRLLNFGPQHPATHGVLRVLLTLSGEDVLHAEPEIGFLHRGIEKILEGKRYDQIPPFLDRLDYLSPLCNEHAWALLVEQALGITVPKRGQYLRVLCAELTRLLNHLIWLGTTTLDIGAMSVFLYTFRERERIYDLLEAITGARMHGNYICPGGVRRDVPEHFTLDLSLERQKRFRRSVQTKKLPTLDAIATFLTDFPACIDEYESLLTNNPIWQQRTIGMGIISSERACALGFSGPMLRASGIAWDLRRKTSYDCYDELDFTIPVGSNGDAYDRYRVRIAEMRESTKILTQCIDWLNAHRADPTLADNAPLPPVNTDSPAAKKATARFAADGFSLPPSIYHQAIEHPKGEFGITCVSDKSNRPYRIKFRPASLTHLASLDEMLKGHRLADVVAVLSSIDFVLGDTDR